MPAYFPNPPVSERSLPHAFFLQSMGRPTVSATALQNSNLICKMRLVFPSVAFNGACVFPLTLNRQIYTKMAALRECSL